MPYLYEYLVDENDDYILDENGDKIIVSSTHYTDGTPYRRIAAATKKVPYVRSFEIRPDFDNNSYLLIVNQKCLIGRMFPTKEDALSVLYGVFTRAGGHDSMFEQVMTRQLSSGVSKIISAEDLTPPVDPNAPLDRAYSYGLNRVAARLMEDGAVHGFGDSFTFGFMPQGRARHWRPKAWVGFGNSSNAQNIAIVKGPQGVPVTGGNYNGKTTSSQVSSTWPPHTTYTLTADVGAQNNMYAGWFFGCNAGHGGAFVSNAYLTDQGTQDYFLKSQLQTRVTFPCGSATNSISAFKVFQSGNLYTRSTPQTGGRQRFTHNVTTDPDGRNWSIDGTPDAGAFAASESGNYVTLRMDNPEYSGDAYQQDYGINIAASNSNTEQVGDTITAGGFLFRRDDGTKGLSTMWSGYGGKTASDFSTNLTNEYIKHMLVDFTESNVCIIQFGHNDFNSGKDGNDLAADIETAINKIKASLDAGYDMRYLIILGNETRQINTTSFEQKYEDAVVALRAVVDNHDDVAFLDGYSATRDTYGNWDTLNGMTDFFAETGATIGVHPAALDHSNSVATGGADLVAELEWAEIDAVYNTLDPYTAPTITDTGSLTTPGGSTVATVGQTVSQDNVVSSDAGSIRYEWLGNGKTLQNSTSNSFTIPAGFSGVIDIRMSPFAEGLPTTSTTISDAVLVF